MKKGINDIKTYKNLFIVESILLSIVLIIFIIIILFSSDREKLISQSVSEDGTYKVTVSQIGSQFIFSSNKLKITYGSEENSTSFVTTIDNDGIKLNDSNYQIIWKKNVAIITLKGAKQLDTSYLLTFTKDE